MKKLSIALTLSGNFALAIIVAYTVGTNNYFSTSSGILYTFRLKCSRCNNFLGSVATVDSVNGRDISEIYFANEMNDLTVVDP